MVPGGLEGIRGGVRGGEEGGQERGGGRVQVDLCPLGSASYSHSVVPGGLEVRSNITLEMPGIFLISFTIFITT